MWKSQDSPSLAEGARGWVDTTSASQAGLATANDKNATTNNANANFASISKADSALSAKSLKDTHPQTPSTREGALKEPNTPTLREGAFEVAPHARNANSAVCHTTIPSHT